MGRCEMLLVGVSQAEDGALLGCQQPLGKCSRGGGEEKAFQGGPFFSQVAFQGVHMRLPS